MAYLQRVKRLEKKHHVEFEEVLRLIKQGAYYDELTDEEKYNYCEYQGTDKETMETIEMYLNKTLHFKLEKKPKPPTKEEFERNRKEIEEYMDECIKEFNSPEAVAEREREYQERKNRNGKNQ